MTEQTKEDLSALVDGTLDDSEVDRLLVQIRDDEELRRLWGRYHLVGDLLRGEKVLVEAFSLADRVQAQLRDEPAIIAAPRRSAAAESPAAIPASAPLPINRARTRSFRQRASVRRLVVGAALAASVAGLAVFISPLLTPNQAAAPLQLAARTPAPEPLSPADIGGNRWKTLPGTPPSQLSADVTSRLNGYLVQHSNYASLSGMGGVLPYTTFVSYDRNR